MAHPAFHATRCGIAFGAQALDAIPHDPQDLPVHLLVTEQGVVRCNQAAPLADSVLDKSESSS